MNGIVRIPAVRIKEWGMALLQMAGVSEDGASDVMDVLVDTQLRGIDTHGIVHLRTYLRRVKSIKMDPISIINETNSTCLIDGGQNLGHIVGCAAMRKAIELASQCGLGAVAVRNSNHFGAAGYYSKMAAAKGFLGFAATNGSARVAPWGGADPVIGNNPSSLAFPGPVFPIVFDMAVTVAAGSKIVVAKREGRRLPEGWAMDKNGKPTTDPDEALEGLLMPIGGYKGVGISVMIDLICGALSGGKFSYDVIRAEETNSPQGVSHFFAAVDISRFVSMDLYLTFIKQYAAKYKSVRLIEGYNKVFMPGEIEWNCEVDRRENGIPFTVAALNQANDISKEFGYKPLLELP